MPSFLWLCASQLLLLIIFQLVSSQVLAETPKPDLAPVLIVSAARQLTMLDGQAQSILASFDFSFPLHEKVWRSSDGKFAYLSSSEGWIIQVDLPARAIRRQLRIAQQTLGLALSNDDRYLMVANSSPGTLIALNAVDFSLIRRLDVKDKNGKASAVAAIHSAIARKSFIAVMRDIPELWEMSYDKHAEPIYEGFVHDYKMGEGIALSGPFPPRRSLLEQPLEHVLFDTDSTHAIGAGVNGLLQVINLNIRRKICELHFDTPTLPESGQILERTDSSILLLPSATEKKFYVIDIRHCEELATIDTRFTEFSIEQQPLTPEIFIIRKTKKPLASTEKEYPESPQLFNSRTLQLLDTTQSIEQCDSSTPTTDAQSVILSGCAQAPGVLRIYELASKRLLRSLPLPHRPVP